jgi:hypothetical protein
VLGAWLSRVTRVVYCFELRGRYRRTLAACRRGPPTTEHHRHQASQNSRHTYLLDNGGSTTPAGATGTVLCTDFVG